MKGPKAETCLTIAVDFDGTCVEHKFPEIGEDIGAVPVLKELVSKGHKLILYTMRSDQPERKYLSEAIQWFVDNKIELYSAQVNPSQDAWTSSPKCYADLYIDDAAVGVPLSYPVEDDGLGRGYVNWDHIKNIFKAKGVL